MADLLGSILGRMEKPPTLGEEERKKAKEEQKKIENIQQQEKDKLKSFRVKTQKAINDFIKDNKAKSFKFKPMPKVFRAILHEVSEIAGLTSFSFGEEEVDRYVMVWKKEFAPTDEELSCYRKGEDWDPEKAKQLAELKALQEENASEARTSEALPQSNYREKYERIIGKESAKEAAQATLANRSYGFVSSENKRDRRTIEEVMADSRAKKKLKADDSSVVTTSSVETCTDNSEVDQAELTNHDREDT